MKNILLLVHDDEGQEARLQAALDITRAVEGHLTCVDVVVLPQVMGDFYSGAGEAMLLEDERVREDKNRERLEARLGAEGLPWNWVDTTGGLAPCLTDASVTADLIVVNRKLDAFPVPDMAAVAAKVVLESGKPVFAVPDGSKGIDLGGRVLVAWDGSACAASALREAVPLLKLAGGVTILEVENGSIKASAEDAAAYLSRHGITPNIRKVQPYGVKAGQVILDEMFGEKFAYLVMGGFGHLRFAEALLGGVSRLMLKESPIPLFMAH